MQRDGNGRYLDLTTWKRREHFELYRSMDQPFFGVTVEIEVTRLWRRAAEDPAFSFFLASGFALLRGIHATEALRRRLDGDAVWVHDRVGIGTTVRREDETFAFARLDLAPTWPAFREQAAAIVARARQPGPIGATHDDDLVYHTTLPWLRFTSFKNPLRAHDSIPRVAFGKVFSSGDSFRMPLAVEVHHALVDGFDVARFVDLLETEIARDAT